MATTAVGPDVVGTAGAAEICGVEVQRISRWKKKGKMPEPAADTASGPVYWRSDIEALARGESAHAHGGDALRVLSLGDVQVFLGVLLDKPKLSKTQIGRWREDGSFPEPCIDLPAGKTVYPLWWAEHVKEFAAEERGRPVSQRAEALAWREVRKALEEKRRGRRGES